MIFLACQANRKVLNNAFTRSEIGGELIPLHSDIDFVAEIEECHCIPARAAK